MRPQLHITRLDMLEKCGHQYDRCENYGERKPPGIAAIAGTGTHHSGHTNLKNKIATGELLTLEECEDLARDGTNAAWEKGVWLSADERAEGEATVRGATVDKAVRLSRLHREDLAPELDPVDVEWPWVIEAPGYPFDLAGTIDVLETRTVRDLKTKKQTPSKDTADNSDQLTMYALAIKAVNGYFPDSLWLDTLVDLKTPKLNQQRTTRDAEDIGPLLRRLERAAMVIEKGAFTPARREDWWCSPKYCGWYDECPFVRGRTIHTLGGS